MTDPMVLTDAETQLYDRLLEIGRAEGSPLWLNRKPERWFDDTHWRCANDHVSTGYLKSEQYGRDLCFACRRPVWLTFPEDRDGPLVAPP